ncbi:MAG TPA: hypothetical protein VD902_08125, partial [Symbiobacteriaceae bacterium]|nr:hypothetical protein [Symbiobacteriaceae bacterium]
QLEGEFLATLAQFPAIAGDGEQAGHWWRVFRANAQACAHYRPGPYEGDVLLVRAGESPLAAPEQWRLLVRGVLDLRTGAGGHHTMLSGPNLAPVVRILQERLDALEARLAVSAAGD